MQPLHFLMLCLLLPSMCLSEPAILPPVVVPSEPEKIASATVQIIAEQSNIQILLFELSATTPAGRSVYAVWCLRDLQLKTIVCPMMF